MANNITKAAMRIGDLPIWGKFFGKFKDIYITAMAKESPETFEKFLEGISEYHAFQKQEIDDKLHYLKSNDALPSISNDLITKIISYANEMDPEEPDILFEHFARYFPINPLTNDFNEVAENLGVTVVDSANYEERKKVLTKEAVDYINSLNKSNKPYGGRYKETESALKKFLLNMQYYLGKKGFPDLMGVRFVASNKANYDVLVEIFHKMANIKNDPNVKSVSGEQKSDRGRSMWNFDIEPSYKDKKDRSTHYAALEVQVVPSLVDFLVDEYITHDLYKGLNGLGVIPSKPKNTQNDFFEQDYLNKKIQMPYRDTMTTAIRNYAMSFAKQWGEIEFINNFSSIMARVEARTKIAKVWFEGISDKNTNTELLNAIEPISMKNSLDSDTLNEIRNMPDISSFDFVEKFFADISPEKAKTISIKASKPQGIRENLAHNSSIITNGKDAKLSL